jgi:hypothetical protein
MLAGGWENKLSANLTMENARLFALAGEPFTLITSQDNAALWYDRR